MPNIPFIVVPNIKQQKLPSRGISRCFA
uniref:Uncharacterized protein n=1 Tax=Arundo donax TaxID=35708 RepID=A0A0A9AYA4_ARUDO